MNKYSSVFIQLVFIYTILLSNNLIICDTFVEVNEYYENTKIFTSNKEIQDYDLRYYFRGFNLEYKLVEQQPDGTKNYVDEISTNTHIYSIQNAAQEMDPDDDDDYQFSKVKATDMLINNKGEAYISVLSENDDGYYDMYHGIGNKQDDPFFDVVNLGDSPGVKCFDLVVMDDSITVIDCIQISDSLSIADHCFNHFYVINHSANTPEEKYQTIELNNCYLEQMPFQRRSILYDTSHNGINQQFIVQGIQFDQQGAKPSSELYGSSYLNIFRYIKDGNSNKHKLIPHPPITGDLLGYEVELDIIDFGVLNQWIWFLDNKLGLVIFQYHADKVIWKKDYFPNIPKGPQKWGAALTFIGSNLQILIVESQQIKEYHLKNMEELPEYKKSYKLNYEVTGTVEVQSNTEYIALKQGKIVTIYDQYVQIQQIIQDDSLVLAQIENVQNMHLWYSNNLYIFKETGAINCLIQPPVLQVNVLSADQDTFEENIQIQAVSKDFFNSEGKEFVLKSVIIKDEATKQAYSTNYPDGKDVFYQNNQKTVIPLEILYNGPNMGYQASKAQQQSQTDGEQIFIDIPQQAKVKLQDEQNQQWEFAQIIPSYRFQNSFYTVHQNKENHMHLSFCTYDEHSPLDVSCGPNLIDIPFTSQITEFSRGEFLSKKNIFGIVLEQSDQFIYFFELDTLDENKNLKIITEPLYIYNIQDVAEGGFEVIINFTISHNTLYTVVQKKETRFIRIENFSQLPNEFNRNTRILETIDQNTIKTWPLQETPETWYPESISVNDAHPNLLFIRSDESVLVVSVLNFKPSYVNMIPMQSYGSFSMVVPNSFVLAYSDEKIYDFSLENLNFISSEERFQYQVRHYGYEFLYPFTITSGLNTGFIYTLALERKSNDLKCLIYRAGTTNLKTLYKVIHLESNFTYNGYGLVLAAGGTREADYVYIQYNDKKVYLRSPTQPTVQINPSQDKFNPIYLEQIAVNLKMVPWQGTTHDNNHTVEILNPQTHVITNQEIAQQAVDKVLRTDGIQDVTFEYDTSNWWSGSVISLDIACSPNPELCGNDRRISLQQIVEKNEEFKQPENLTSIADIQYDKNSQRIFTLSEQESGIDEVKTVISIFDNEMKFVEYYNILEDLYGCDYLELVQDVQGNMFDYIILYCFDYEGVGVKWDFYKVFSQKSGNPSIRKSIKGIEIEKNQYKYFNDKLYINSVTDDLEQAGLYIINVDHDDGEEAQIIQQFNHKTQGLPNDFSLSSFVVSQQLKNEISHDFVKIIASSNPQQLTSKQQIVIFDLNVQNNYSLELVKSQVTILDYMQWVRQQQKQYATFLTRITGLNLLNYYHQLSQDKMKYNIIIMNTDTAFYQVEFTFSVSGVKASDPTTFIQNESSIKQIYNNYGLEVGYNQISILDDTMATAYFNRKDGGQTTLVFYNLQGLQNGDNSSKRILNQDNQNTKLNSINGGYILKGQVEDEYPSDFLQFSLIKNKQGKIQMVNTDVDEGNNMMVLDYHPGQLKIFSKGHFPEQNIELKLINDYSSQQQQQANPQNKLVFKMDSSPKNITPKKGDNSHVWVIVLVSVLGVAIIGGLLFFYYKKKKQVTDLGNDIASETGYSLQEPTRE